MSMRPQLFSGTRAKLVIAGKPLGFITDISVNVDANVRGVHTLGAPNARSVEPLSIACSASFSRVIPVGQPGAAIDSSMIAMGIEPLIGQLTTASDITLLLTDDVTGNVVASINNCRFAGRSMNASAGQIATERVNLVGIYENGNGNSPKALGF